MPERTRPAPSPTRARARHARCSHRPAWTASPPPLASSLLSPPTCRSARPPPCSPSTRSLPPASSVTASSAACFSPVYASRPDAPGSGVEHELGCSERKRAALLSHPVPAPKRQAPQVGFPYGFPVGFYGTKGSMVAAGCRRFVRYLCAGCSVPLCSNKPSLTRPAVRPLSMLSHELMRLEQRLRRQELVDATLLLEPNELVLV